MKDLDVVGIGSMVVDLIHRAHRFVGPDDKVLLVPFADGSAVEQIVGGVTLNHLAWARCLGLRAGLFGRQAADDHGRFIRTQAAELGLQLDIRLDGRASSFSLVFVAMDGARGIYMAPGATADTLPHHLVCHLPLLRRAHMVSTEVSQLPLATVIAVLEAGRAAGATTLLDVDLPPHEAVPTLGTYAELEHAISLADVLKPTAAAARALAGEGPLADVARRLWRGRRLVGITDGAKGSVVCDGPEVVEAPAFRVPVVDTTGAGDAWFGGLIAGLSRGLPLRQLARLANACGATCVEAYGAVPGPGAAARVAELLG